MTTQTMPVQGMTCGNCVKHVDKALRGVSGVSNVSVDLASNSATVSYDEGVATKVALVEAVKEAGYTLEA